MKKNTLSQTPTLDSFGDLLTVSDLSAFLGIGERAVRLQLCNGQLPGVKIGARWFVPKARLLQMLGLGKEVA